ncbi:MAG: hypothetical protein ACI9KE_004053 [Polyangiales bacterium]|jgi:hypothetical protein
MAIPRTVSFSLSLFLGLSACSSSNVVDVPDAFSLDSFSVDAGPNELDGGPVAELDAGFDATLDAGADVFDAGAPPPTALAECLEAGGAFRIVNTIDNNDTRDHGPILTFDVSDERQIVVSTVDATLKFWTLDSFQGETGLAQLTYGPEITATSIALDFWEELAVAGDSQGVIAGWSPEFGMNGVLGGTAPGIALVALAIDDEGGFLAQADADGTLLIRPLPGFEGETVQLEGVHAADLAWANGVLFAATPSGIEARDIGLNLIAETATGEAQLHIHADADVVVAGGTQLRAFDTSLRIQGNDILSFLELKSLTLVGGHPVGLFGGNGATPYIEVQIQTAPGEQQNTMFIFESTSDTPRVPVQVVADPQGELLFVAFEDGLIELLSCEN